MTKKAGLTREEKFIVAAALARSNAGMGLPDKIHVRHLRRMITQPMPGQVSLSGAVNYLCGSFMETDEHQEMFEAEARGFVRDLRDEAKCREWWPDVFRLFDEARP